MLKSSWIGGSIAGNMNKFESYWISNKDYKDNGLVIVNKKCPYWLLIIVIINIVWHEEKINISDAVINLIKVPHKLYLIANVCNLHHHKNKKSIVLQRVSITVLFENISNL